MIYGAPNESKSQSDCCSSTIYLLAILFDKYESDMLNRSLIYYIRLLFTK